MTEPDPVLGPWPGPYGGVPPLDRIGAANIEAAVHAAIAAKRAAVAAIVADPAPPTFANSVEVLEAAGAPLRTARLILGVLMSTASLGDVPETGRRLVQAIAELDDEIAFDDALFARIAAVRADAGALERHQARLTEVVFDDMSRRGAGLPPERRARLTAVNRDIAGGQARFRENELGEAQQLLWVTGAAELDGLPEGAIDAARRLAADNGRAGAFAFANARPGVWLILQHARNRDLRRRARDMWVGRNAGGGAHDNRALVRELVALRAEKAALLGYPSYAHLATAPQMARTPARALDQLRAIWGPARRDALRLLEELQALADADGLGGPVEAHDFLFYAERRRERRFAFDGTRLRDYLTADAVVAAMFEAASRLHGLGFRRVDDVPVIHPDVQAWEVSRAGAPVGVLMLDLLARPGKMPSAWMQEVRQAERWQGPVLPISLLCANVERPTDGTPPRMPWEIANVLFHEFGHALHMQLSRAPYPSLGSIAVAWDAIELPSQLNERWFFDPDLLRRHMRHWRTGEPLPDALIESLIAVRADERVVSVTPAYLAPAIVDLEMFGAPAGTDPFDVEARVLAELDLP
ncbi:MAG: hypothetical protein INF91_04610, partial [Alphaproteobacteria bacterium]|nr:hypothetical protein [Alphaproteobacteria bacterium]